MVVSPGPSWRVNDLVPVAAHTGLELTIPKQPLWTQEEVNIFRQANASNTSKNTSSIGPGQARCWMGHMNALKHILLHNWTTALVVEDDVDWDISIKKQMEIVGPMIRKLTNATNTSKSPFGDNWDLLWLGHCGDGIDFRNGRHEISIDRSLPESTVYHNVYGHPTYFPPQLRIVHHTVGPSCTFAYAVTLQAASKMYAGSRGGSTTIITTEMRRWCETGWLRCLTINPELFHHHKKAGEISSQIALQEGWDDLAASPERSFTPNIRYSARCNYNSTRLVTCRSKYEE